MPLSPFVLSRRATCTVIRWVTATALRITHDRIMAAASMVAGTAPRCWRLAASTPARTTMATHGPTSITTGTTDIARLHIVPFPTCRRWWPIPIARRPSDLRLVPVTLVVEAPLSVTTTSAVVLRSAAAALVEVAVPRSVTTTSVVALHSPTTSVAVAVVVPSAVIITRITEAAKARI